MENKEQYNKVMLAAFCIMVILLAAGFYSKSRESRLENLVPAAAVREAERGGSDGSYEDWLDCFI